MQLRLTADELRWPGVDKQRACAAAWHLYRAAQWIGGLDTLQWRPITRRGALIIASEHARIARGYLGAIGFEQGGRL